MFEDYIKQYVSISENSNWSNNNLDLIRADLAAALDPSPHTDRLTVVVTGSYGRGEASKESDLDLFIFFDSDLPPTLLDNERAAIASIIKKYTNKEVGSTGTFGENAIVQFSSFLENIGGSKDSNLSITRRMLFLLEGTWLYGKERFEKYQAQLLDIYIKSGNPDGQISRFLLNDIIRYYRTITTDFEYKVVEDGKSWGLRNIKLRFSRKMLYFGGVVCVAEVAALSNAEKNVSLKELLSLTALQRLYKLGGTNDATQKIFETYDLFLRTLNSVEDRNYLENVSRDNRECFPKYVTLRNVGSEFSLALDAWLKQQYPMVDGHAHPIHHALVF